MAIVAHDKEVRIVNLARGTELVTSLQTLCMEEGIHTAHFTGLGAAEMLELAYYNLSTKTYERHTLNEEVEILSLTGNICMVSEKPLIHVHGVFGRRDLSTFGGHVFSLQVSGACELHITSLQNACTRKHDPETGLNLMCAL